MRGKVLGALAGLATVAAVFVGGRETAPVLSPEVRLVTGIRVDGSEFDGLVVNGKLQEGVMPVAPFMSPAWENADIRDRNVMTWCLSRLPDESSKVQAREVLTTLYGFWSNLPMWREGCQGTSYFVDDTAQTDCGIGDGAVGCAVYGGLHAITVSINGNMYRDGRMRAGGARATFSHEAGHAFGLGHTTCEWPQPSSMNGIYLPDGPPCGAKGTNDPILEDYGLAITHYGLIPWNQTVDTTKVHAQRWIELSREPGCPQDQRSGDWCIFTTILPKPHVDGSFYPIVVDRNGELSYPYGWAEVRP